MKYILLILFLGLFGCDDTKSTQETLTQFVYLKCVELCGKAGVEHFTLINYEMDCRCNHEEIEINKK